MFQSQKRPWQALLRYQPLPLRKIVTTLLPHHCPLCESRCTNYLCERCEATFIRNDHACFQCALPLPACGEQTPYCAQCLTQPAKFDRIITAFVYNHDLAEAITLFKDRAHLACGQQLSAHLAKTLSAHMTSIDALVPVPLHWRDTFKRGFNQAEEIARVLSKRFDIPVVQALSKPRATTKQKTLSKKDRMRNLTGAFAANKRLGQAKRVALIDDVVTTGCTANICATVLKQQKVDYVELWALARTP